MKISEPYFSQAAPLLGRRIVDLEELDNLKDQREAFVKITDGLTPSTLINLAGPINADLENFIRLARAKARRILRIVESHEMGAFPDWLQALDVVLLSFPTPVALRNAPAFNEAIQALWFARHEVRVSCLVRSDQDLPITELLHSYTPNDIPFYIEVWEGATLIQKQWLTRELSQPRFATARVVLL